MQSDMLYPNEMIEYIRSQLGERSQAGMARDIGEDETAFSRMLNGRREISDRVAEYFGMKKVVLFVIPRTGKNELQGS